MMSRLYRVLALTILQLGLANAASATGPQPGAASSEMPRISMDVWKRPLREVAAQLARRGSVDILVPAAIDNLEVSASLVDVDPRAALQRLLAHRSYMLIEHEGGRAGEHGRNVIEIMLFGTGAQSASTVAAVSVHVAANEDRSIDELVQLALSATSDSERAAAVDAMAYRDPQAGGAAARAKPVLLHALSDPAEEVRAQAIATIKDTSDEIPLDALSQVAREDASADLRVQALELLVERSEHGEAREALDIALNDAEAAVRERARELAEDWHVMPAR